MPALFQTLLLLLGFVGTRLADAGDPCAGGACPAVPDRPVVAWGAPQTLRADEVRLFARESRRPGQPGPALLETRGADAVLMVAPAPERLRALTQRARGTVVVRVVEARR